MKPYDKKNNDTYVEYFSQDLVTDIECHMFGDPNGNVKMGNHRGFFSVESRITAQNNILQHETAKLLGTEYKLLKLKEINGLLPYSLIKRYKRDLKGIFCRHKTPVFFNTTSEKFVTVMDKRVLRDLEDYPEFRLKLKGYIDSGEMSIVNTSIGEQLLLNYETIDDLYKDTNNILKALRQVYEELMVSMSPKEDMIIVAYESTDSSFPLYIGRDINVFKEGLFKNTEINFEFVKACKLADDSFFFYDSDGKLAVSEAFYIDKDKIFSENTQNKEAMHYMLGNKSSVLVYKYSDKEWDLLLSLKKSIDDLFGELDTVLLAQKSASGGLDIPLTKIVNSGHILLEDKNLQSLKFK